MVRLYEVARVIRTKNAGPFKLTIDIFLNDVNTYMKLKSKLSKELIAKLYNIREELIEGIHFVDSVLGVKITMIKDIPSDDLRCSDVYGAQQHGPLINLELD
jgi:dimeric dUTPase (all-alpha-NTP-PPase superfamily)